MRLPNHYGTVYKLKGKRRNPWIARKMIGFVLDEQNKRVKYKYLTIGYYPKKDEALQALARYNDDPYDPLKHVLTLSEVYEAWSVEKFPKVKSTEAYRSSYALLEPLWNEPFSKLKLDHFQNVMNASGKNTPVLRQVRTLINNLYDYAVIHEIVPKEKADMMEYLDVGNSNPNKIERKVFEKDEVQMLWKLDNPIAEMTLILIYTGMRVSELIEATDIDIENRVIRLHDAKTLSGIREVPIAEKIVPLVERYKRVEYHNVRRYMLNNFNHYPHDTRHTFTTRAAEKMIDQRLIDAIVGHKDANVSLRVYTHFSLESKLEVVNLLEFC